MNRRIVRIEGRARDDPVLEVVAEFPDRPEVYPETTVFNCARNHRDEDKMNVAVEHACPKLGWVRYAWFCRELFEEDRKALKADADEQSAWLDAYRAKLRGDAQKKKVAAAGRTK